MLLGILKLKTRTFNNRFQPFQSCL